jgi:ABC-type transport system substrate-binding protein
MDAANATVDEPKRIALYRTVQALFAEDDPSIILWFRKFTICYRSDLENFSATPVILTPFWNPAQYRLR